MFFFDPMYLIWVAPAMLLGMWAQWRVHSAYAAAREHAAPLSGAAAARHILESAGETDVVIEQVPGQLTDHYDPRQKVLRLSSDVYSGKTLAAVGIAAHEAGHALQDAQGYSLMAVRNAAVGVANIGSGLGILVFMIGLGMMLTPVAWIGIALFAGTVFFQLVTFRWSSTRATGPRHNWSPWASSRLTRCRLSTTCSTPPHGPTSRARSRAS